MTQLMISEGFVKVRELDETAVKLFCRINGMKFSEDWKNSGIINI